MMSKKSPQLRFEGFTDDWEERKLGDVLSERNDQTPETNEYPLMSFVQGKGVTPKGERYNRSFLVKDSEKKYKKTELGDFIYSSNNLETGSIGFNRTGKAVISPVYSIFESKKSRESQFIGIMSARKDFISKMVRFRQGVVYGQWRIHESDFLNIDMKMPNDKEQQLIISFFENIDKTIALHQRKLDLLKEQKKGYLQKMFPKNGAKVPELRFAGFADDWEERKFKDIIEKLTGGASIKPSDYLEEGIRTIPKGAVNSTGLADLSGSKYISEEFYESNKSSHVSTNNLVTSLRDLVPSAPNMGRIVRIAGEDEDFLMPQGVYKLELFDGMDEEFLIAFSNSDKYRKIISSEKNGSTQVHIRNGEFLNIDIELPFSEEQKQIGSFFKQLDNSIALHQHKLDLLKEQKKGFLQKMFV